MCDPNLFYGFPKKKKKQFFQEIHKLRDELMAVVKVTKKTLRKGEGGSKSVQKTKNCYVMSNKTCMEVNLAPNKNNSYLPIG